MRLFTGAVKTNRKLDWPRMLCELEAFRKAFGHVRVNEHWERYPELTGWLVSVRGDLGTLSYARILSLDRLGFFNDLDHRWLDTYARLQIFKQTLGHCDVPGRWGKNPALGIWVRVQRTKAKEGKMASWRRKLLSDLGFRFQFPPGRRLLSWDNGIKRLCFYRRRFGNCNVPSRWSEDRDLGRWVGHMRAVKKSLDVEKRQELDRLGFEWNPIRSAWEKRFMELVAFQKRHGHCLVPDKSGPLGTWVSTIRLNKERQSKSRIRRLDQIGFDWCPNETTWRKQYGALLKFKQRFGHANVPHYWKEDTELSLWVSVQRRDELKLSQERRKLLKNAGFDWNPNETAWRRHYEELKSFRRENGHCNPPSSKAGLGKWVEHQRAKAEKMPAGRKKLLDEIGFVWRPVARGLSPAGRNAEKSKTTIR